jgi:uncharacterized membrane protein
MLILLKRWFLLAAEGERRFDQIRFGLSVASSFRKDVVITAPSSVPFFSQDFQAVVDKTNLSLPGWTNIVQSGKTFWKGTVYSGTDMLSSILREPRCYPMSLG